MVMVSLPAIIIIVVAIQGTVNCPKNPSLPSHRFTRISFMVIHNHMMSLPAVIIIEDMVNCPATASLEL